MSLPFLFLLASLACFRLTRLISDDRIFDWLRRLPPPKSKTREGLACPFCVSWYWSSAITLYLFFVLHSFDWQAALLWQPSVWGLSVLFNQVFVALTTNR